MRVTVPVEANPPVTLAGLKLSEDRAAGITERPTDSLIPFKDAVIFELTTAVSDTVVTVKT